LRLFSFGGYGLALAAMAIVVFGAYDTYPRITVRLTVRRTGIGIVIPELVEGEKMANRGKRWVLFFAILRTLLLETVER